MDQIGIVPMYSIPITMYSIKSSWRLPSLLPCQRHMGSGSRPADKKSKPNNK